MAKRFRRAWIMSLILVLTVVSLAACSKKSAESNPSNTAGDNSSASAAGNASQSTGENAGDPHTATFKNGKFDPPITMTVVRDEGSNLSFKDGENMSDNVHTRWVKDNLGIEIKYLWTTRGGADAFNTKLRLMLSANEKMPDIIPVSDMTLAGELIDSGKFMDVGEVFDKYASATWKKAMAEDPTVWYPVTRDGKKYGIPNLDYTGNGDPVLWIRTDWLEKLHLKAPKTLEELEKVMDAFVNQDPDGNNKKDTYGITFGLKNGFRNTIGETTWLFGAYGAIPEQWNDFYDGGKSLQYGSIQPQMKDGLAKLKEWMDKGYTHKEIGLWDNVKSTELFIANQAGIISGPLWLGAWPLPDLFKNVPGAKLASYEIPVGPSGKAMRTSSLNYGGVILISKDMEHPDALFEYFNSLFDNYANPESTSEMAIGLAEGYDWVKRDGKILTEAQMGTFHRVLSYTLTGNGARFPSAYLKTIAELGDGKTPETPYEINKAGIPMDSLKAGRTVLNQMDASKKDQFIGAPTPTMKSRGDALKTMEKETFTKIVYGEIPLDQFDKFVEKWKSSGGDKWTKEVNDWYSAINK